MYAYVKNVPVQVKLRSYRAYTPSRFNLQVQATQIVQRNDPIIRYNGADAYRIIDSENVVLAKIRS